jgi:hypothetical protein
MEPLIGVETIAGTAGTAALRYKKRRSNQKPVVPLIIHATKGSSISTMTVFD